MNLREEINKVKMEERKFELSKEMLKFLKQEEISNDNYNKIIDELQRCIDERIDLSETKVYSKQVNEMMFSNNVLPVEVELFKKEYRNYLNFKTLNKVLKQYTYNNIKDKYNNEDIEDIIWFLYKKDNMLFKKITKLIDQFLNKDNNYISLNKHDYKYWYYIFIIKKMLETQEYIFLNDLDIYSFWTEVDNVKRIAVELNIEGIYLFNLKGNNISLNNFGGVNDKESIILVKENPDKYNELDLDNPEDKEKYDNSILSKIKNDIIVKGNLSLVHFRYIIKNIYKDLSNKYLEEISTGSNYKMRKHAYYASMCDFRKIIKSRVDKVFENLKETVPFSYYKDIKIFVPNYYTIVLLYKRYFAVMSANVTRSGWRHTIDSFEVQAGFLSENDYYHLKDEDFSYEADFGGLMPRGITNSPVSVTNHAIIGGVLGGSTGAMLGAISAQEKNSQIEKNKNTNYELKKNIKNIATWVIVHYSNRSIKKLLVLKN